MEILWLLIPMSAVLVLIILAVFGWALHKGQFEDLEGEGERILTNDNPALDRDQVSVSTLRQESPRRSVSPK